VIILAIGAVLVFPSFLTRDPWNPDEPRYVEVAREMVALNDYVVPHLDGYLYPDKPPLFFWLAAGLYKLGAGITSGRFVAAFCSLTTLLLVYFFGRKLLPSPGALLAAVITATTFLFFGLAKPGVIDPLLTTLTTAALVCAYYALQGGRRRWILWLVYYGLSGLAVLSKGPVGLLVPGVVVLAYAIFNRKSVSAGGWAHAAGVALFVCVVGAWLVPVMIRAGEAYTKDILFNQQAVYTIRHESHAHGPHYYIIQLPLYLLPWVFFAALGMAQTYVAWRRRGDGDAGFLLLWFVSILAFFTVIPAKRERYLLPLIPAVGLMCARYFALALKEGYVWPKLHKWFSAATFGLIGFLAVSISVAPWVIRRWVASAFADAPDLQAKAAAATSPNVVIIVTAVSLVLLGVTVAGIRGSFRKPRPLLLVSTVLATMVFVSLFFDLLVCPLMNPVKSGRYFANRALPYMKEADRLYLFSGDYSGVVNLYTGITSIPILDGKDRTEQLVAALQSHEKVAVITDAERVGQVRDLLPETAVMPVREQIGHRSMVLICNWKRQGEAPPAP
jgi:4-amino-4-deoxy-L-arabinose transferase-like glycosyltransferase